MRAESFPQSASNLQLQSNEPDIDIQGENIGFHNPKTFPHLVCVFVGAVLTRLLAENLFTRLGWWFAFVLFESVFALPSKHSGCSLLNWVGWRYRNNMYYSMLIKITCFSGYEFSFGAPTWLHILKLIFLWWNISLQSLGVGELCLMDSGDV